VAFALFLSQQRHSRPPVRVHRAPSRRGPGLVEEVTPRLGEGQEDPGPSHRHPNPEGGGPEGVGHHQRLLHEEGGAANGACASPTPDGA